VSLVEWLSTGRADIGLLFNPAPSPAIEIMPWLEEPMCLVARREAHARGGARHSIGLAELARLPLILASRPNAHRMLIDTALSNLGLRPTIALEVDGVGSILKLVAEGCGQTVLPRTSLRGFGLDRAFSVRPIVRPSIPIRLALAVSAQRPITPLTQGVLNLIRELAGGGMTMLIATHEMAFARDIANRVCFLDQGVLLEEGPPEQIFRSPENPRTQEFLQRIIAAGRL